MIHVFIQKMITEPFKMVSIHDFVINWWNVRLAGSIFLLSVGLHLENPGVMAIGFLFMIISTVEYKKFELETYK